MVNYGLTGCEPLSRIPLPIPAVQPVISKRIPLTKAEKTYFSVLILSIIAVLVVLVLGTMWNSIMLTLSAMAVNMTIAVSISEYRIRHKR